MKYFTDTIGFGIREMLSGEILPLGEYHEYVGSGFLDAFVNHTVPIKAYLLNRYHEMDEELSYKEVQVQDPPGSFRWVKKTTNTKQDRFNLVTQKDRLFHVSLSILCDDVILLNKVKHSSDVYFYFWFDRDVSDCRIARFQTSDPLEDIVAEFDKHVSALNYSSVQIPLHFFSGGISS